MKQLLIFPYNGNGLEALDCLGSNYEFVGFVDDTPEKQGLTPYGHSVYGRDAFDKYPNAYVLAVPGSPASYHIRHNIIESLGIERSRFATVIHPGAHVSPLCQLGHNVLLMAGVVITSNAKIGDHVCILPNTVIHHDDIIGDYTLIGSNVTIAGNSSIGRNCYIGSGTRIINGIEIGANTLIGIGSNVIKSLPNGVKAVGNPAKVIGVL